MQARVYENSAEFLGFEMPDDEASYLTFEVLIDDTDGTCVGVQASMDSVLHADNIGTLIDWLDARRSEMANQKGGA